MHAEHGLLRRLRATRRAFLRLAGASAALTAHSSAPCLPSKAASASSGLAKSRLLGLTGFSRSGGPAINSV